jgi:hypothetical protein
LAVGDDIRAALLLPRTAGCVCRTQEISGNIVNGWKVVMANQSDKATKNRRERLAEALGIGSDNTRLWQPNELEAMFRHQMASPVAFDLEGCDRNLAANLKILTAAQGLLVKSFGDLLRHPHPPLDLLRLTKDFAKRNRDNPESLIPAQIADALYYLSIAAALVQCGKRITRLTDVQLQGGFAWVEAQDWIDDEIKQVARRALRLASG